MCVLEMQIGGEKGKTPLRLDPNVYKGLYCIPLISKETYIMLSNIESLIKEFVICLVIRV